MMDNLQAFSRVWIEGGALCFVGWGTGSELLKFAFFVVVVGVCTSGFEEVFFCFNFEL